MSLEYTVWIKRDPMIIRRDALSWNDPDSIPQLYYQKFGEPMSDNEFRQVWGCSPSPDDRDKLNAVGRGERIKGLGHE